MHPHLVVEVHPVSNYLECHILGLEAIQPNTFLFEEPKKSLDHTVLLWRIRGDVLLLQTVPTGDGNKVFGAENKSIVHAEMKNTNSNPTFIYRSKWI
jgi:hypothetical protein